MLTVQILNTKSEVLSTIPVDPITPHHEYVSLAVMQTKEMLHSTDFAGKNVRIADQFDRTIWLTYYGR